MQSYSKPPAADAGNYQVCVCMRVCVCMCMRVCVYIHAHLCARARVSHQATTLCVTAIRSFSAVAQQQGQHRLLPLVTLQQVCVCVCVCVCVRACVCVCVCSSCLTSCCHSSPPLPSPPTAAAGSRRGRGRGGRCHRRGRQPKAGGDGDAHNAVRHAGKRYHKQPYTSNLKPQTLNPKPQTLNPKP